MSYFTIGWLLAWLTGNPLLAILILAALYFFGEGQLRGSYRNPFRWFTDRAEISRLQRTLTDNPHDLVAHGDLGRLQVKLKRYKAALPHLQEATAGRRASPEAWYFLGLAWLGQGQLDKAQPAIDKALELRDDLLQGEPYLAVGNYHFKQGQYDEALPWLQGFLARNSSSSEANYKLGVCHMELGKPEEARRALREAIEVGRSGPGYKRRQNRAWKWRARLKKRSL